MPATARLRSAARPGGPLQSNPSSRLWIDRLMIPARDDHRRPWSGVECGR